MTDQYLLETKSENTKPNRAITGWLFIAAALAFLAIVLGYVTRISGAGAACPDFPTCYGQWGIPETALARLNFAHRVLSGFLMIAAVVSWLAVRRSDNAILKRFTTWGGVLVLAQALVGFVIIMLPGVPAAWLHSILAYGAASLYVAAIVAHYLPKTQKPVWRTPFARLTIWSMIAILVLMTSGAVLAKIGSGDCAGYPFCAGGLPATLNGWLELSHRFITLISGVLMVMLFNRAWRSQRSQPVVLTASTAAMVLFAGQVLVGAAKVLNTFPADLIALHAVSSAGLWMALVLAFVSAGYAARDVDSEKSEVSQPLPFLPRLRDFVLLNKPIIVVLLLVTTYAGMVVGAQAFPAFGVTILTIISGALAAGGSSALNQYIDRDLDRSMQRTAKRPLPDGRLTPGEGLAYGTGAVLASFFLMASLVNLLSALLLLAGAVYYVLLYSIWLKKLTVQNIVIGGGAGAIPPLVGWAAVTGSLDFPALFLFAIVFLWTPPHFWALALVRQKDYARAGVPMLPVVRGETVTRNQILFYTVQLVLVTLLMPVLNMTGLIFLISALLLGAWLLSTAWKVRKNGGNKLAWKMYRYSSMYLGFIFLALMIDAVI